MQTKTFTKTPKLSRNFPQTNLIVSDPVKNRFNFSRIVDCDGNRVTAGQSVVLQSLLGLVENELFHHFPLRKQIVHCQVFHVGSKTLTQPKVVPPLHRYQVPKPLVNKLVSNDGGNLLMAHCGCLVWIIEYGILSVCDKTCSFKTVLVFGKS